MGSDGVSEVSAGTGEWDKSCIACGSGKSVGAETRVNNELTEVGGFVEAPSRAGVFNLLSSRANVHLSYNPAGRNHCRLQNHHGYIKHHHRGMGSSPGDVGEVPMTWVKQWKDCRMSCDVGKAVEGLENEL